MNPNIPLYVSTAVTVIILGLLLFIAPMCGLIRRKLKLVPALILFGVTLLAGVAAAVICRVLNALYGQKLYEWIMSSMDETVRSWIALMPTAEAVICSVIGQIASFMLFIPIFILVYIICRIATGITLRVVFGPKDGKRHLSGFLVGLGNGFLLGLILLIPFCTVLTGVCNAVNAFEQSGVKDVATEDSPLYTLCDTAAEVSDNPILVASDFISARPIEAIMVSKTLHVPPVQEGGEETVLPFDLESSMCELGNTVGQLLIAYRHFPSLGNMSDFESLGTEGLTDGQKKAVDNVLDAVLSADWLTQSAAELVSNISSSWLNHEDCLGLEYPTGINEMFIPTLNTALSIMADETGTYVKADVNTVKEIIYTMLDSHLLTGEFTYDEVMERMWGEGIVNELLAIVKANEHLNPLTENFKELGFSLISRVLTIEQLQDGTYDSALREIAPALEEVLSLTSDERAEKIRQAIQVAFEKYGIRIPDELAISLAEEMIAQYGQDGTITSDELMEFLLSHYELKNQYAPDINIPSM